MNNMVVEDKAIWAALRQVIDPEIGCNIVDLGLIYGLHIEDSKVDVAMTLTTPGCPMQESLVAGVRSALLTVQGVDQAEVELVWDPPWHPTMITAQGEAALGRLLG